MHPNPFDHRLRLLKDGNPTTPTFQNSFYENDHRHSKKLAIVWEDGRMEGFSYGDFKGPKFVPDDPNILILKYWGETVTLKGYNLDRLAFAFLKDEPEILLVTNTRYTALSNTNNFIITEAIIENEKR